MTSLTALPRNSPVQAALIVPRWAGLVLVVAGLWVMSALGVSAQTGRDADASRLDAFLSVTGFDTALDSIALSAADAPMMLGLDANDFGADWTRTVEDVFDPDVMQGMAVDILGRALSDDMMDHAVAFYASDLGQRLVAVENAAHMADDGETSREEGARIVAELVREGAPRLELLQRMGPAIDPTDNSVRAVEEIQIRFLLSASAAGVVPMELDEASLRLMMEEQRDTLRLAMRQAGMAHAAYVYRDFDDAELEEYVAALEHPAMQRVYELMNAIQYEIMANRFEVLAVRMADLHPGQEL